MFEAWSWGSVQDVIDKVVVVVVQKVKSVFLFFQNMPVLVKIAILLSLLIAAYYILVWFEQHKDDWKDRV